MRPCALLVGIAVLAGCARSDGPPEHPNLILYLVDTLRQDHLGVYGAERETTPRLDELARESVVFTSASAASTWTKASTGSVLTGLYPVEHGAMSRGSFLAADVSLLGEHLAPLDYYRAAVVTNAFVVKHWGFDRGYEDFHDLGTEPRFDDKWHPVSAARVHRKAFEVLDARPDDRPFFLYVHTIDVHGPNSPAPPYDTLFSDREKVPGQPGWLTPDSPPQLVQDTRDLYDGEIRYSDEQFGAFLDGLRERGLYDDTMLWFLSDHGEEFLDHGRGGHGTQLFDEVLKVPLIVKLPHGRHGGTVIDAPVSLIDVTPTILRALGLQPPAELPGVDLFEALDSGVWPERPIFFDLDLVSGPEQILHVSRGVRIGRYKYFEEILPEPSRYLFDVVTDPSERRNLVEAEPERAASMAAVLNAHRAASRSGLVLTVVGDKLHEGRTFEARLTTDGAFVSVDTFDTESDDAIDYESGASEAFVRLRLVPQQDNAGLRALMQDHDSVNLRVEPEDATVRVESIEVEGGLEMPLFRGMARRRADLPASLAAGDSELRLPELGLMFTQAERDPTVVGDELAVTPGVYAVSLPGPEGSDEDVPTEIWERLRGLGYVE